MQGRYLEHIGKHNLRMQILDKNLTSFRRPDDDHKNSGTNGTALLVSPSQSTSVHQKNYQTPGAHMPKKLKWSEDKKSGSG